MQAYPLVILMGGGPGNASISQDTSRWLGSGFARRGWMVAVPISPTNRSFRGAASNALIVELISELQKRENIARGQGAAGGCFQWWDVGVGNCAAQSTELSRRGGRACNIQ